MNKDEKALTDKVALARVILNSPNGIKRMANAMKHPYTLDPIKASLELIELVPNERERVQILQQLDWDLGYRN